MVELLFLLLSQFFRFASKDAPKGAEHGHDDDGGEQGVENRPRDAWSRGNGDDAAFNRGGVKSSRRRRYLSLSRRGDGDGARVAGGKGEAIIRAESLQSLK